MHQYPLTPPLDIVLLDSSKTQKASPHSAKPQAIIVKRGRRPRATTVATEIEQQVDSSYRRSRSARKIVQQIPRSSPDADTGMCSSRVSKRTTSSALNHTSSSKFEKVRSLSILGAPPELAQRLTRTGRLSKAKKGLHVHNCDKCGKIYTRAEHLRRHLLNHDISSQQYSLGGCPKQVWQEDLLNRQFEEHRPLLNVSEVTNYHDPNCTAGSCIPANNYPSPSHTPSYTELPCASASLDPPTPFTKQRAYSFPVFTGTTSVVHSSPFMVDHGCRPTASLEVQPSRNYTWHTSYTAPSTFQQQPAFDYHTTTPLSSTSFDNTTMTSYTQKAEPASSFPIFKDMHSMQPAHSALDQGPLPYLESEFLHRETSYGHVIDPLLARTSVNDIGIYPPERYFSLTSAHENGEYCGQNGGPTY